MTRFFIDRPIFAWVISIVIVLVGAVAVVPAAGRAVPRHHAADRAGHRQLPRGQRPGGRRQRGRPHRAAGQRRRAHDVHVVAMHQRRQLHPHRHLRDRHRPQHGPGAGAEPRVPGHGPVAHAGADPGRQRQEEVARAFCWRSTCISPERHLRRPLPEQLRHDPDQGRAAPPATAWATSPISASATTACASGSTRRKWRRAT